MYSKKPSFVRTMQKGMTEVTTDTTDCNDRPVAVGGIGNYVAARSVVSEFFY